MIIIWIAVIIADELLYGLICVSAPTCAFHAWFHVHVWAIFSLKSALSMHLVILYWSWCDALEHHKASLLQYLPTLNQKHTKWQGVPPTLNGAQWKILKFIAHG